MLYTGLIAASSGDSVVAEKHFKILSTYNPYFEEGIIAAADFYRKQNKERLKPYTILAEAMQINGNSIQLVKAYIAEAVRQGFDEYAASASQQLNELEMRLR